MSDIINRSGYQMGNKKQRDRKQEQPHYVPMLFGDENKKRYSKKAFFPKVTDLHDTPGNHLPVPDTQGVCAHTPGGTEVFYSPTQTMRISTRSPGGQHTEEMTLSFATRKPFYHLKKSSRVFHELSKKAVTASVTHSVTATPATFTSKPNRSTQPTQHDVIGCSAQRLVTNFFEAQIKNFTRKEIAGEDWNLCHLLSYAIAKNAKADDGTPYDPQAKNNIFAGSRVFNENMMCIEAVLIKLLEKNEIRELKYVAIHSIFENSHILASLVLEAHITTHTGKYIKISHPFAVDDNRQFFSKEFSETLYGILTIIMENTPASHVTTPIQSAKKEAVSEPVVMQDNSDSVVRALSFT